MRNQKVPFLLNPNDGRPLVGQLADGLRQAIVEGHYRPGDVLPSYRDLAPLLGVSEIVTRGALRRLAAEGLVVQRPRIGTVVRDRAAKQWRGHVVLVGPEGDDNYLMAILSGALRDGLLAEGYLFTWVRVRKQPWGSLDLPLLDVALSRSVDLVVALHDYPGIFRSLAARKVPYVRFGRGAARSRGAAGFTAFDYNLAVPGFAAACAKAGVGEVVEVYWGNNMCDIAPGFAGTGIAARKMKVSIDCTNGAPLGVERAGRLAMERMIEDWSKVEGLKVEGQAANLPTFNFPTNKRCLFFADDHLARGALAALSYAGLRAPDDILVATWANTGLGPDYPRELSRMEFDPALAGREVARCVVECLKTGAYPTGGTIGPKWIDGETMGGLA